MAGPEGSDSQVRWTGEEACQHCIWWRREFKQNGQPTGEGFCHRFPPTPISATKSAWSKSAEDDACGEFREKV